ncbi:hypothetical protein CPC08DRAFT_135732 [Agrocybe pediades]|nr:hypothetical protein CPC08DRAFT_135732 [Agrocybe pediades]
MRRSRLKGGLNNSIENGNRHSTYNGRRMSVNDQALDYSHNRAAFLQSRIPTFHPSKKWACAMSVVESTSITPYLFLVNTCSLASPTPTKMTTKSSISNSKTATAHLASLAIPTMNPCMT